MKLIPFAEWDAGHMRAAITTMQCHVDEHRELNYVEPGMVCTVLNRLYAGELRAVFIGGYLLVYDVGPLWWGKRDYLHECLLRRAWTEGTFNDAVDGMIAIAELNGCLGIVTGNGIHRPGLRRLYERRGFRKMNETYFLEVSENERSQEDCQHRQEGGPASRR